MSPLFATTNTMYSLWLARDLIDEPVLLVESDVVFSSDLLAPLLEPERIAVSRQLPWMNGSTVTLDADGYVNALYSPPPGIYFQHCTSPDHFITVNMCSLAAATWRDVGERLDRYVAAGHTGYFHDVVFADMIAERVHGSRGRALPRRTAGTRSTRPPTVRRPSSWSRDSRG